MAVDPSLYADLKKDLIGLIRAKKCNPLMIRLAWHDSGTYDKVCMRHHGRIWYAYVCGRFSILL